MTPTQRSLAYLRKVGYDVFIVERFNAFAKVRNDLMGFADLLASRDGVPLMFVQVTTAANASKRRQKILHNPYAKRLVGQGLEVVLHAWGKRGARGETKRWTPEPEWMTEDQFANEDPR